MSRRNKRRRRTQATRPPVEVRAKKEVQAEPDLPAPERNDEQTGSGFWFVQVPIALVRNSELSHTALRVYAALASYANSEKTAWPGQARLATDIGVSERTIRFRLKELEDAGHIVIKRRGRRKTNLYFLPGLPDRKHTSGANNGDRNQAPAATEVSGIRPAQVSGIQATTNDNQQNKTQRKKKQHQLSAAGAAADNQPAEFDTFLHIYTTEIGPASPAVERKLTALVDAFPVEWFRDAVVEATLYNATHKLAYAIKVMQRWRDERQSGETIAVAADTEDEQARDASTPPPANPVIHQRLCDLFDDSETSFSPAEVWMGAMGQLRLQMDKATFRWLRDVQVVDLDGDALVIRSQGGYAADLLQHRLLPALTRTVSTLAGRQMTVRVVTEDRQHAPAA
jgi:hypothetical protein